MRYDKNRENPLWKTIERAVGALEKNSDLAIRTDRDHVIGYLTECVTRRIRQAASTALNSKKGNRGSAVKVQNKKNQK